MPDMEQEEGVIPHGPHTAWSSHDGCSAEVRKNGEVVKKYRGETAWSDAVREAGDRNVEAKRTV